MIHGVVKGQTIVPLDPIPPEWVDGRQVNIEVADGTHVDDRAEIERWFVGLSQLGAAQYEAGEREAIESMLQDADREAKESMKRSWARFDGVVSP